MSNNRYHPADIMIVAISQLLYDREVVFHGVSSHIPMIAIMLAKSLHGKDITYLNIPGGVNPYSNSRLSYTSAGEDIYNNSECIFPLQEVFDLSMRGGLDVAFLSGVQFDKRGNVNASIIGDYFNPKVRLPGGAGSAVLIPTAKRAIIWRTKHDKRTFLDRVDFVTTRGNIDRIVTPMAVFKFDGNELDLEAISPMVSIEEVVENTGFKISTDNYKILKLPTDEEMRIIKEIDKRENRYLEFR